VDKSITSVYDPNKAKALLAAGGYCNSGVTKGCKQVVISFDTTQNATRLKTASILQRAWASVGITLIVHSPKPSGGYGGLFADYDKNGILNRRSFDVALFAWSTSPSPDWSAEMLPQYIPTPASHTGTQNYAAINDPKITAASVNGLKSLDMATRVKIYDQLQLAMADNVYWIPLYTRTNITIDNGTIVNYTPNPSNAGNDWNAFEWSKKAAQ
jgi:peptide/nickel transport system substrate-binding protein